ncbi:hypothetical protein ACFR9U_06080 [Halorientalis brevis]|uniref:Uncharacterized protein n=1 Tax=Halorientalis brevis TaxID=1126241 RepID=A0ABD6CBC4_9EURY|nr:hypothetical protein [Halorientalis brevis]
MDASRLRLAKGAAVSLGSFVLFGVVTGLIPNPIYVRMVPSRPVDYLFLVLTAGLLGVYVAQRPPVEDRSDDRLATLGTVGGFLAFGCPICNAFLLALFSSSALMTYFDPLRPLLGAVAVVLLGGLVYARYTRACETCQPDAPAESAGENHG